MSCQHALFLEKNGSGQCGEIFFVRLSLASTKQVIIVFQLSWLFLTALGSGKLQSGKRRGTNESIRTLRLVKPEPSIFRIWINFYSLVVSGLTNLNRAFDGDVVAVELLPEDQWSSEAEVVLVDEGFDAGDTLVIYLVTWAIVFFDHNIKFLPIVKLLVLCPYSKVFRTKVLWYH